MGAEPVNFQDRASLEQLQQLQYALDQFAMTAMLQPAGTLISANDKLLQISGYKPEDMLHKPFHHFLAEDFRPFFTKRRRKAPGFSHGDISRRCPAELGTTSSVSMYRAFLL